MSSRTVILIMGMAAALWAGGWGAGEWGTPAAQAGPFDPTTSTLALASEPGRWEWFWINRVEEFRAENKTLDPGKRHIVFLGDSLTQGFRLNEFFPGLPVLNRGIGSDGVCDFPAGRSLWRGVTRRLDESIYACRPSHLVFLIGTNDVGVTGIPLDYWFGAYKYVIAQAKAKFPDVKIICVTCPPTGPPYKNVARLNPRIIEWNALIREFAAAEGYPLIDLHALMVDSNGHLPAKLTRDGLHFNQDGYTLWADALKKILAVRGAE